MVWFSPLTQTLARREGDGLAVRGPGCDVQLGGAFAEDFLTAFLSPAQEAAAATEGLGRLGVLVALGRERHRRVAELARRGGGRPWEPLAAFGSLPTLFLEVVGRCNERCLHCYAESAPEVTDALELETCLRVISEGAALGFARLQLTGGDPLLCSFLPELAAAGRHAGFRVVEVYTNGLALSPERLEALAASDVAFAFSFYSHDPARHDRITRVPGSHARTLSAITRALARGLGVRVSVVALDSDAAHVEQTFAFLEKAGVPREALAADQVRTVGRGAESGGSVLPDSVRRPLHAGPGAVEASAAHGASASAGPAAGGVSEPEVPPVVVRWPGKLCVAYTGQVHPCIFARSVSLGDVRRESLGAMVERARARRAGLTQASPDGLSAQLACADCRYTVRALGGGTG